MAEVWLVVGVKNPESPCNKRGVWCMPEVIVTILDVDGP